MAAVLVTSKKKAIVVPGSTPPKNQELVPLQCTYEKVSSVIKSVEYGGVEYNTMQ